MLLPALSVLKLQCKKLTGDTENAPIRSLPAKIAVLVQEVLTGRPWSMVRRPDLPALCHC
jgi:hypothetical protein